MKCSFCGNELEPGAGFCPNCGTIISLDNDFVSPKQTPAQQAPSAAPVAETPQPPVAAAPPAEPAFSETLNGMPQYVSPTFEAYQPAQLPAEDGQTGAPEDDDDDPFRELHPDLDDAPAAPEIPAEAQISDAQPVATDGAIPVYEPTEELPVVDEEQAADGDYDDMYVDGEPRKKRWVPVLIVALLLAASVGAWYYVKTQNPFLQPTADPTASMSDTASQTETTPVDSESQTETTEDTTEDTTDESTDESTSETDATDESTTDESTTNDEQTDLSADENELTAPQDTTESTTRPTTETTTTTRPATTTQRATTTTTRPTTTAPRATTTTRATTQPTTRQSTTQAANTLQRPTSTFAARTMYVSEDGVALRYAPNSSSGNRVSLSVGADVSVTAEQNGYYYVYSNRYGVSGWVSKRYLGASRPVAQRQQSVSGLVQPDVSLGGGTKTVNSGGTGLNLRKGPGTGYDVIHSIGDGYPVAVKGKSSTVSGWVYVTDITRGVSGWVASAYLD